MLGSTALSDSGPRRRRTFAVVSTAAALALIPATALADTDIQAESLTISGTSNYVLADANAFGGSALKLRSNGYASKSVSVPEASIRISARARGEQCSGAPQMTVDVDGVRRLSASVSSTTYTNYSASLSVPAGTHSVKVSFANDYRSTSCDRNLIVDSVSLVSNATTAPTPAPTPAPTATPIPEIGGSETLPTPTPTPTPTTPAADPVIAAAGDIACDPASSSYNGGSGTSTSCRQKATSNLVHNRGFAKVLPLGDIQYENGTLDAFNKSYHPTWGRFKSITSPAVGNHEYRTSGAKGYFDYFNGVGINNGPAGPRGKGYYSYNIGKWHVVSLNSNCGEVSCSAGSTQEQWLKADLAANQTACTLVYWHHPRFSSGEHGNGTATDAFFKAAYAANADLVLTGHDHGYERFAPQNPSGGADSARGIRQFVVGSGGKGFRSFASTKPNSQVRNSGTAGILEVTLRPTSYDWTFRPEAGRSFTDSGSTNCH